MLENIEVPAISDAILSCDVIADKAHNPNMPNVSFMTRSHKMNVWFTLPSKNDQASWFYVLNLFLLNIKFVTVCEFYHVVWKSQ